MIRAVFFFQNEWHATSIILEFESEMMSTDYLVPKQSRGWNIKLQDQDQEGKKAAGWFEKIIQKYDDVILFRYFLQ